MSTGSRPRILVVYCYYEKDQIYYNNFLYFFKHAIAPSHNNNSNNNNQQFNNAITNNKYDIEFDIVINGRCQMLDLDRLRRATSPRCRVRIVQRENYDYDFGAYNKSVAIREADGTMGAFDYMFFLNTSVRGPFLPSYYKGHWLDPFLDLFRSSVDVHLVGTTINVLDSPTSREALNFKRLVKAMPGMEAPPYTHVQSQAFMMDRACYRFLSGEGFFSAFNNNNNNNNSMDFSMFIALKEVMMSQLVLKKARWNIACLVPEYRGRDYRRVGADFNPYSNQGDPCFHGACFGRTVHPFEVVFIKTNRGIHDAEVASLSAAGSLQQ
jgi:hypothetical protein